MKKYMPKKSKGFTVIEILMAVVIVAILSAILITTINPTLIKKRGEDALKAKDVKDIVEGLATYRTIEGEYPVDTNANGLQDETVEYIAKWPSGLTYQTSVDNANYSVVLSSSANTADCFKYVSCWPSVLICDCATAMSGTSCDNPRKLTGDAYTESFDACSAIAFAAPPIPIPPVPPAPPAPTSPPLPPVPPMPPAPTAPPPPPPLPPAPTAPPAAPIPIVATFYPTEDTFVRSDHPTQNNGTNAWLGVDTSPMIKYAYLKFDLSTLAGKTILDTVFRIQVSTNTGAESTDNQNVFTSPVISWSEATTVWNNRPNLGVMTAAGEFSGGIVDNWTQANLNAGIQENVGNVFTLYMSTTGTDGFDFRSRESAANSPRLIITYQ